MLRALRDIISVKELRVLIPSMAALGIALSLTSPYLALYCTGVIGMSSATYGILMAVFSICGVAVNSLIARRSDGGMNRKRIIVLGTAMSSCLYLSYLWVHNVYLLFPLVAIFAGLGAPIMPQIFAYARESIMHHDSIDSTFTLSTVRSMFSLGFLIGPLIGAIVLAEFGYTGILSGTSGTFVLIGVFVILFLRGQQSVAPGVVKDTEFRAEAQGGYVRTVFIAFVLFLVAAWTYNLVMPLFIVHTLHAPAHDVGVISSISAGLEIPIMLWFGSLTKRIPNKTLVLCGAVAGLVYYVLLGFTTSVYLVMGAQLLQATYVAVVFGNGLSFFQDLIPHSPGRAATLYANATSIGMLVGNLEGGALGQWMGYRNVYYVCIGLVVVAFSILFVSNPAKRSRREAETFPPHSPLGQ